MSECGAKTRAGKPCRKPPVKGATRCRLHGGAAGSGAPVVHGRYALRFHRLTKPAQDAIDSALLDPDLLDARRPVAVHQAILEASPLLPDDDTVVSYARHLSKWRPNFDAKQTWEDQPEPSLAELEVARLLWADASAKLAERYGNTLSAAARAVKLGDLLAKELVPLFSELGLRMRKLADRFVAPDKRADFEAAYRIEARATVAAILRISEDDKP